MCRPHRNHHLLTLRVHSNRTLEGKWTWDAIKGTQAGDMGILLKLRKSFLDNAFQWGRFPRLIIYPIKIFTMFPGDYASNKWYVFFFNNPLSRVSIKLCLIRWAVWCYRHQSTQYTIFSGCLSVQVQREMEIFHSYRLSELHRKNKARFCLTSFSL